MEPYAVQVMTIPFAKKPGGLERIYLTLVDVEDVGVVIEGPDKEGDVLVLFDERVERINPACLNWYEDATRLQLWKDALWLEVGDQFEAVDLYFKHYRHIKDRIARSGKVCSACGERKPLGEFRNNAARRDGVHNQCRSCEKMYDDARQRSFQ